MISKKLVGNGYWICVIEFYNGSFVGSVNFYTASQMALCNPVIQIKQYGVYI